MFAQSIEFVSFQAASQYCPSLNISEHAALLNKGAGTVRINTPPAANSITVHHNLSAGAGASTSNITLGNSASAKNKGLLTARAAPSNPAAALESTQAAVANLYIYSKQFPNPQKEMFWRDITLTVKSGTGTSGANNTLFKGKFLKIGESTVITPPAPPGCTNGKVDDGNGGCVCPTTAPYLQDDTCVKATLEMSFKYINGGFFFTFTPYVPPYSVCLDFRLSYPGYADSTYYACPNYNGYNLSGLSMVREKFNPNESTVSTLAGLRLQITKIKIGSYTSDASCTLKVPATRQDYGYNMQCSAASN